MRKPKARATLSATRGRGHRAEEELRVLLSDAAARRGDVRAGTTWRKTPSTKWRRGRGPPSASTIPGRAATTAPITLRRAACVRYHTARPLALHERMRARRGRGSTVGLRPRRPAELIFTVAASVGMRCAYWLCMVMALARMASAYYTVKAATATTEPAVATALPRRRCGCALHPRKERACGDVAYRSPCRCGEPAATPVAVKPTMPNMARCGTNTFTYSRRCVALKTRRFLHGVALGSARKTHSVPCRPRGSRTWGPGNPLGHDTQSVPRDSGPNPILRAVSMPHVHSSSLSVPSSSSGGPPSASPAYPLATQPSSSICRCRAISAALDLEIGTPSRSGVSSRSLNIMSSRVS